MENRGFCINYVGVQLVEHSNVTFDDYSLCKSEITDKLTTEKICLIVSSLNSRPGTCYPLAVVNKFLIDLTYV